MTYQPKPSKQEWKIRQCIKIMAENGASPVSIVFAVGRFITPDERDFLLEYEKIYKAL